MSTTVVSAEAQEAANVAWSRMQRRNVHHLVVMENGRLHGTISEGAFGRRSDRAGRMVEDVMTPLVVSAESDRTLEQAANLIGKKRIGCLPVVDGGQLVGIVTVPMSSTSLGADLHERRFRDGCRGRSS
jgi:acetoin utilization protein AcuB